MNNNPKTADKHAIVTRDGYDVPLIGIPPSSVLETCDLCGNQFPIRDIIFTGVQTLCRKCNDYES